MNVEVFAVDSLLPEPELSQLKADFKAYKEGRLRHPDFGKDAPFTDNKNAESANLWHMHLIEAPPTETWIKKLLHGRDPTSDKWLIYTCGDKHPNKYLLINIACPDAHRKARGVDMGGWIKIAESFAWRN